VSLYVLARSYNSATLSRLKLLAYIVSAHRAKLERTAGLEGAA
jgi:hypothetical protein